MFIRGWSGDDAGPCQGWCNGKFISMVLMWSCYGSSTLARDPIPREACVKPDAAGWTEYRSLKRKIKARKADLRKAPYWRAERARRKAESGKLEGGRRGVWAEWRGCDGDWRSYRCWKQGVQSVSEHAWPPALGQGSVKNRSTETPSRNFACPESSRVMQSFQHPLRSREKAKCWRKADRTGRLTAPFPAIRSCWMFLISLIMIAHEPVSLMNPFIDLVLCLCYTL